MAMFQPQGTAGLNLKLRLLSNINTEFCVTPSDTMKKSKYKISVTGTSMNTIVPWGSSHTRKYFFPSGFWITSKMINSHCVRIMYHSAIHTENFCSSDSSMDSQDSHLMVIYDEFPT